MTRRFDPFRRLAARLVTVHPEERLA
jgi:hypothetical protein